MSVGSSAEGIYVLCNLMDGNVVTFSTRIVAGAPTPHAGLCNDTACLGLCVRTNLASAGMPLGASVPGVER